MVILHPNFKEIFFFPFQCSQDLVNSMDCREQQEKKKTSDQKAATSFFKPGNYLANSDPADKFLFLTWTSWHRSFPGIKSPWQKSQPGKRGEKTKGEKK